MIACISEPISWPRLEHFATRNEDPTVAAHLAQCAACARCLTEITGDLVALPPLVVAAPKPRVRSWWFAVPVLAAAAIAVMVLRPKPVAQLDRLPYVATIKGTGEVTLGLVRERAGVIVEDATTFAPGDRWKVVVTCAPGHSTWLEVSVVELDGAGSTARADHPLAPTQLACGNRVVMPGAFELTGHAANTICVRVSDVEGTQAGSLAGPDVACLTVTPE